MVDEGVSQRVAIQIGRRPHQLAHLLGQTGKIQAAQPIPQLDVFTAVQLRHQLEHRPVPLRPLRVERFGSLAPQLVQLVAAIGIGLIGPYDRRRAVGQITLSPGEQRRRLGLGDGFAALLDAVLQVARGHEVEQEAAVLIAADVLGQHGSDLVKGLEIEEPPKVVVDRADLELGFQAGPLEVILPIERRAKDSPSPLEVGQPHRSIAPVAFVCEDTRAYRGEQAPVRPGALPAPAGGFC